MLKYIFRFIGYSILWNLISIMWASTQTSYWFNAEGYYREKLTKELKCPAGVSSPQHVAKVGVK